ncbi:MAG: ParA family protein [Deltaproteobacteria bacterium]|nr:MAG: ParA family protein [Deltaproteobacteria bacterium]
MHILAIASAKGGVGKSTVASHLSGALAFKGAEVLLVDADPQGGSTCAVGAGVPQEHLAFTAQLLSGAQLATQRIGSMPGLRVVGARPDVDSLQLTFPQGHLRAHLERVTPVPDFVILDLAPSLEPLTLACLGDADGTLVVLTPTALTLRTLPTLLQELRHACPHASVEGLLINHLGAVGGTAKLVLRSVHERFGDWVFPVELPEDECIQRAMLEGHLVFWEDETSPSSRAFLRMADELLIRYPGHADPDEPISGVEARE